MLRTLRDRDSHEVLCSVVNINLDARFLNVVRVISVDRLDDEHEVTVGVVDERMLHVHNAGGVVDAEASFFCKRKTSLFAYAYLFTRLLAIVEIL